MKRLVILAALILSACAPIRPEPSAFTSPMMQPVSFLAAPQPVFSYLLPVVMIAPAPVEPALACGLTTVAEQMSVILTTSDWQRRVGMECDYRLVWAATDKAKSMAEGDYLAHDNPNTGETPNELVERFGCKHDYGRGNQFESLAAGYSTPEIAFANLLTSPHHRAHIAGTGDFFLSQRSYGVGYANNDGAGFPNFYVILIAECQD